MEDLTGRQFGPYVMLQPLGAGGTASVYKAYQPSIERYVAVKILPQQYVDDPALAARFKREATMLASLQHSHVLPVFDFGQQDGRTFIVTPFMAGGTLATRMGGGPLPVGEAVAMAGQIAGALGYVHAHGLTHRDVKPSNVLLDADGNCLLSDFGIGQAVEGSIMLAGSGSIQGTPAYMSPEQGRGEEVDARGDIYALGVVLFEMLTGQVPYHADTPMGVMIKHGIYPLPSPRTLNPAISEALEQVVVKALAKAPDARFQTAAEFQQALEEYPQVDARKAAAAKEAAFRLRLFAGIGGAAAILLVGLLALALSRPAVPAAVPPKATETRLPDTVAPTLTPAPTATPSAVPTVAPSPTVAPTPVPPTPSPQPTTPAPTATPEPTATLPPTATKVPAPTQAPTNTPAPRLAAPQMLAPVQNAALPPGEVPRFQWSSAGALGANQFYRVTVEHRLGFDVQCTQKTTISARDYIITLVPIGRPFRWTVSVVQLDQPVAEGAACEGPSVAASGVVGEFTGAAAPSSSGGGGGSGGPVPATPRP